MANTPLTVLYEDNHLLAIAKPAHLATMGVAEDQPSLLSQAKDYIKHKYNKPGNVYLGIVSRLDAPVTGVVIMARTSKAASRLTEQFRRGEVDKRYWAVVAGFPKPSSGTLVDWLRKDERHRKVQIVQSTVAGAKRAELSFQTLEKLDRKALLEVELITGRKHQIRVQLAHSGHPIVGDRKYGSKTAFPDGIALHACRLSFQHPVRSTPVELVAPLPQAWGEFGLKNP